MEERQFQPFAAPVNVYVTATADSCHDFCRGPVAGCVVSERLFICPKAEGRLPAILTHELSHLHMEQHVGFWNWASVPPWFQEGLAVEVSDGGGAENVPPDQALQAVADHHAFTPAASGSVLFHEYAADFHLSPHMFYRQSGLFVAFLRARDPAAFRGVLTDLATGEALGAVIARRYGVPLGTLWDEFSAKARTARL